MGEGEYLCILWLFFLLFSFLPPQKYCDTNQALCLTMFAVKVVQSK